MDERFGLFVIIVLGETVIAVATGVGDTDWRAGATLVGLAGVGFEAAIEGSAHGTLTTGEALMVTAGVVAYLAGVTALQWAAAGTMARAILNARVGAGIGVVAVGVLSQVVAVEAVIALAVLLVTLVVIESRMTGIKPKG